ncbi:MAG TPA: tetratricopeptide repeat protein, partial [Pyrinomonadaceae bacterium]|nr:tetratricopeptide repeat protein [Pyrinomonadaceae bacterium]
AIKAYKEAIRLRRAFVDADSYYRLGTAYLQIGDSSAAIDPLKQSLYMIRARVLDSEQHKPAPAAPPQAEVNYALGLAYYGSGAFRNAATEFENAIRLKQDFASAHFGLGLSHLSYGDRRSAEKEEQILRKMKSPLADKLADQIVMPGVRKNRVF